MATLVLSVMARGLQAEEKKSMVTKRSDQLRCAGFDKEATSFWLRSSCQNRLVTVDPKDMGHPFRVAASPRDLVSSDPRVEVLKEACAIVPYKGKRALLRKAQRHIQASRISKGVSGHRDPFYTVVVRLYFRHSKRYMCIQPTGHTISIPAGSIDNYGAWCAFNERLVASPDDGTLLVYFESAANPRWRVSIPILGPSHGQQVSATAHNGSLSRDSMTLCPEGPIWQGGHQEDSSKNCSPEGIEDCAPSCETLFAIGRYLRPSSLAAKHRRRTTVLVESILRIARGGVQEEFQMHRVVVS